MTMLPQHGFTGIPTARLIPTDKTVTYAVNSTLDETRYYLCSTLHQSPKVRSVVLNTFTDGLDHVSDADKKISIRKSTDFAATFAAKTTLYDPTDGSFQVQSLSAGYSNNGRFHALISCHTSVGTPGGTNELRYVYSDDDGTTVSSPATITLPSNGLNGFRMHDKIIDLGNNILIAPAYFSTDEGDATQSSRYVVRSTDGGANWSFVLVEGPTSAFINEGSILAVTNNVLVLMCRYDNIFQYWMYKSTDAGATWVSVSAFSTTHIMSVAAPCALRKFRADNGKWYCVMYFPDKANERLYALYGRLDNGVDAGVGIFNTNTLVLLRQDTEILHYGDFVHYNNNMNARGVWPRESGSFPDDNEMIYVNGPATQYNSVSPYIDPITIYDKLGVLTLVTSSRGLVSNTTNDYGVVDSSDRVTTLKSLLPGPISQNFTATAGGILLNAGGMDYDGTKALSHGSAGYFNFLHGSSAGYTDVQNTTYFVAKFGTSSNPNAAYGLFGNSGASAGNIGWTFFFDDRAAVPVNNGCRLLISKGSAGFIIDFNNANIITPNTLFLGCLEVDLSQSTQNNKVKFYINKVLQSTTVTTFNTGVSTSNATYVAQLGSVGNNASIFIGTIKDYVVQNHVDLSSVRDNFSQALMDANGLS